MTRSGCAEPGSNCSYPSVAVRARPMLRYSSGATSRDSGASRCQRGASGVWLHVV